MSWRLYVGKNNILNSKRFEVSWIIYNWSLLALGKLISFDLGFNKRYHELKNKTKINSIGNKLI